MLKKILLGMLCVLLFIPIYAFKIEPNLVVVHRFQLGDTSQPKELKVLQLSDIQVSESYATNRLDKVIRKANKEKPDVIVLDPPRDGIHPKALPKILSYGVNRIVYVSCKATSLARDLEAFLAAGYRLEKACCVDQFCETVWTEAVALLVKE